MFSSSSESPRKASLQHVGRGLCLRTLAFIGPLALVVVLAAAQDGQKPSGTSQNVSASIPMNHSSDANAQMAMVTGPDTRGDGGDQSVMGREQIANESSRLLALAIALKSDVDKTSKDTLSVSVVREANEIEKLAHAVKERMKLTKNSKE